MASAHLNAVLRKGRDLDSEDYSRYWRTGEDRAREELLTRQTLEDVQKNTSAPRTLTPCSSVTVTTAVFKVVAFFSGRAAPRDGTDTCHPNPFILFFSSVRERVELFALVQ